MSLSLTISAVGKYSIKVSKQDGTVGHVVKTLAKVIELESVRGMILLMDTVVPSSSKPQNVPE